MAGREAVLVTGGAGFIGSAVARHLVNQGHRVIVVDKLTYAGDRRSLQLVEGRDGFRFYQTDICDDAAILAILKREEITKVMHLAAESHVDRSLDDPAVFMETNVTGTFRLLAAALTYWRELPLHEKGRFRFHHVSTDEVFGDLPFDEGCFLESTRYAPSSPYAASKAASDHFVRAWHHTYGLPIVLSNCSNNYGPYHFPEKLVPLTILNALEGKPLPVYGEGRNVRDWLFVDDHARGLEAVLLHGRTGESYNIGGRNERQNIEVVGAICDVLDELVPLGFCRRDLISFVKDRPGHDRRYAIDPTKIETELGWKPLETFASGLLKTAKWYLENEEWWRPIREQSYDGARLGIPA